jgi:hypothetical protein
MFNRGKSPQELWSRTPALLLDHELLHEKVCLLGTYGRSLEMALAALAAFDQTRSGSPLDEIDKTERRRLVAEAARVLWRFVVHREACGFSDNPEVMHDYRVPREVQHLMGAGPNPTDEIAATAITQNRENT